MAAKPKSRLFTHSPAAVETVNNPPFLGLLVPVLGREQDIELIKHLWFLRDLRPFNELSIYPCAHHTNIFFVERSSELTSSFGPDPNLTLDTVIEKSSWYTREKHDDILALQKDSTAKWDLTTLGQYRSITANNQVDPPLYAPSNRLYMHKGINLLTSDKPFCDPFENPELAAQHDIVEQVVPVFSLPFNISRACPDISKTRLNTVFQAQLHLQHFSPWARKPGQTVASHNHPLGILRPNEFADAVMQLSFAYDSSCAFVILPVDVTDRLSVFTFMLSFNNLLQAYNNHALFFENSPPRVAVIILNAHDVDRAIISEENVRAFFHDATWKVAFHVYGNPMRAIQTFVAPPPPDKLTAKTLPAHYEMLLAERLKIKIEDPVQANADQNRKDLAAFLDDMLFTTLSEDFIPTPTQPAPKQPIVSALSQRTANISTILAAVVPLPLPTAQNTRSAQNTPVPARLPRPLSSSVKFPLRVQLPLIYQAIHYPKLSTPLPTIALHNTAIKLAQPEGTDITGWYTPQLVDHWCVFDHDHNHAAEALAAAEPAKPETEPMAAGNSNAKANSDSDDANGPDTDLEQLQGSTPVNAKVDKTLANRLIQPVSHTCVPVQGVFYDVYAGSDSEWNAKRLIAMLGGANESASPAQTQEAESTPTTATVEVLSIAYSSEIGTDDLFKPTSAQLQAAQACPHSDSDSGDDSDEEEGGFLSRLFGRKKGKTKAARTAPAGLSSLQNPHNIKYLKQAFKLTEGLVSEGQEYQILNRAAPLVNLLHQDRVDISPMISSSVDVATGGQKSVGLDSHNLTTSNFNSPISNRQFYSTTVLDTTAIKCLDQARENLSQNERQAMLEPFFDSFAAHHDAQMTNLSQQATANSNPQTNQLAKPYHITVRCNLSSSKHDVSASRLLADRLLHDSLFFCSVVTKSQIISALHFHLPVSSAPAEAYTPSDNQFCETDQKGNLHDFMPDGKFCQTGYQQGDKDTKVSLALHPSILHRKSRGFLRIPYSPPTGANLGPKFKVGTAQTISGEHEYGANTHFDLANIQLIPHFYIIVDDTKQTGAKAPAKWGKTDKLVERFFQLQYPSRFRNLNLNQVNEYIYAVVKEDKVHDVLLYFIQLAAIFRMNRYDSFQ